MKNGFWRVVFTVLGSPDRSDRPKTSIQTVRVGDCCIPPNQVATRFSSKLNKKVISWNLIGQPMRFIIRTFSNVKWRASFRWSFRPNATLGSIVTTTIRKTYSTLLLNVGFLIEFSISDWLKPITNQNQFETPLKWWTPFLIHSIDNADQYDP